MKKIDYILQEMRMKEAAREIHGGKILDIGSFDGSLVRKIDDIEQYWGIDPQLAIPEQKTSSVRYIKGRFPEDLPTDAKEFDVITALAVFEHISEPDESAFVEHCWRVLKPKGRVILTVPSVLVDPILGVLIKMRLIDGMDHENHQHVDAGDKVRRAFLRKFNLMKHRRFQFGLNNLFVLEKR